jgi:putative polyhydroxyalkanoate system protein
MRIEHRHELPEQEAKQRIEALGDYLANKYGLTVSWNGERASITGRYLIVTIEGTVAISPGKVVFEGKDPGMMWRSKARDYLEHKLSKYLDSKTPVESLPRR